VVTNAENARIFGSDDDKVSIGPLGTTLPTTLAAPAAPIVDAGWLHSDGLTVGGDATVNRFRGHQGGKVVRTKVTESGRTFQFQCLETTALTLGLQLNITAKATASGVTTMTVSSGSKVEARAFVVDVYDVDGRAEVVHYRYVIPRGEIGERSEFRLVNSDITGYTFTVEVIGSMFILTNDPAVASS
jgi:hypothetical protein